MSMYGTHVEPEKKGCPCRWWTSSWRPLRIHPVIPSIRRREAIPAALASRARAVLVSSGNIFNVCDCCLQLREHGKIVLVHIDLIGGLGRDQAAVRFLKEKAQAQGIVSPSGQVVTAGRKEGLITIHRLFALDSPSLDTGLKVLAQSRADFIEVLPGVALSQVAGVLRRHLTQPLIAAGLIRTVRDVKAALRAGSVAVDTSAEHLWDVSFREGDIA